MSYSLHDYHLTLLTCEDHHSIGHVRIDIQMPFTHTLSNHMVYST